MATMTDRLNCTAEAIDWPWSRCTQIDGYGERQVSLNTDPSIAMREPQIIALGGIPVPLPRYGTEDEPPGLTIP